MSFYYNIHQITIYLSGQSHVFLAEKCVKLLSGDLFFCLAESGRSFTRSCVCFCICKCCKKTKTPHKLVTVPLNPHEFLNPEDAPKASLGITGVLSMGLEVRPEVEGSCFLSAHSWQDILGHFSHVETVPRQIWRGRAEALHAEFGEMWAAPALSLHSFSGADFWLPSPHLAFICFLFSRLCSSYPQKLLVPVWITDKELENVASFRSWKRIPVVVYR